MRLRPRPPRVPRRTIVVGISWWCVPFMTKAILGERRKSRSSVTARLDTREIRFSIGVSDGGDPLARWDGDDTRRATHSDDFRGRLRSQTHQRPAPVALPAMSPTPNGLPSAPDDVGLACHAEVSCRYPLRQQRVALGKDHATFLPSCCRRSRSQANTPSMQGNSSSLTLSKNRLRTDAACPGVARENVSNPVPGSAGAQRGGRRRQSIRRDRGLGDVFTSLAGDVGGPFGPGPASCQSIPPR